MDSPDSVTELEAVVIDTPGCIDKHDDNESFSEAIKSADPLSAVEKWLKTSSKPDVNAKQDGKAPLHLVADQNDEQVGIVTALLLAGADIDKWDDDGNTALYYAAERGHVEVVKKLLEHRDVVMGRETKPRMASKRDCDTPVRIAAERGHLKEDGSIDEGQEKNPRMGSKEGCDTPAHVAAFNGHMEVLEALIKKEPECVTSTGIDDETPLHIAARKGDIKMVKAILSAKCTLSKTSQVNKMSKYNETPLHSAAESGSQDIVELLLNHKAEINGNPLDDTSEDTKTPLHRAVLYEHPDLALFLLKKGAKITAWAFQDVLNQGYEKVAKAAIESKHWPLALRGHYKRQTKETTAFRELILTMPDVAKMVLDRCVIQKPTGGGAKFGGYDVLYYYEFLEDFDFESHSKEKSETHGVHSKEKSETHGVHSKEKIETYGVSYEEIKGPEPDKDKVCDPASCKWPSEKFTKDNHPLQIMVKKERLNLLTHPVVLSLIHCKWKLMGRSCYYTNLFLYILYLIFLTTFALLVPNPQSCQCSNVTRLCSINHSEYSRGISYGDDVRRPIISMSVLVFLIAVVRLLFEFVQLFQETMTYSCDHLLRHSNLTRYFPQYLSDWDNWIEIAHYVCSIAFVICVWAGDSFCVSNTQWQVGVCAMFLGWLVFILFVSKLPIIGIYVIILLRITWTFVKLFGLAVLLVVAFSLTFFMMFKDFSVERSPFSDVGRALLKTMTMTTGELDYDAIFRIDPAGGSDDLPEIAYPPISYIVWIVFIIMMPVILTNMLTSLAIEDTNDVLKAAHQQKLALQVDLVLTIEEVQIFFDKRLPFCLKRKQALFKHVCTVKKQDTLKEKFTDLEKQFCMEGERYDQVEVIKNALEPEKDMTERMEALEGNMEELKGVIQDMKAILNQISKNLIPARRDISTKTTDEPKSHHGSPQTIEYLTGRDQCSQLEVDELQWVRSDDDGDDVV